jgi:hypothetical protein
MRDSRGTQNIKRRGEFDLNLLMKKIVGIGVGKKVLYTDQRGKGREEKIEKKK